MYDVIIIGAGAAGLFCAQLLGKAGQQVLVLDHANKAGKKILMSGGGRCNFTNVCVGFEHFVGKNPAFVRSALARFGSDDFLAYVYKHGIGFHQREHGELFCNDSAKDIVAMLLSECQDAGVQIVLNTSVGDIIQRGGHFVLDTQNKNDKKTLRCQQLVVATGGLSIPTMGASGFGYAIAEQFGHRLVPTRPSLVPFSFSDHLKPLMAGLAGISADVVLFNERASFQRPILFTHRGLSGPAALQLSNYWTLGSPICVNLLPQMAADTWLLAQKNTHPKKRLHTLLEPLFAKKLLATLETLLWFDDKDKAIADIKNERLIALGKTLNAWQIKPSGTEGYRVAEVTCGGVDTQDVSSKTMQSRLVPNLYFIGEVLDVAGHLGGYNFQWAWASAAACADAINHQKCLPSG